MGCSLCFYFVVNKEPQKFGAGNQLRVLNISLKQQVVLEGAKTEDWGNNLGTIVKSRGKIMRGCSSNRNGKERKQSSYM